MESAALGPTTTPATEPQDAAPDWSAVAEEIECPLCNYNLRGISNPRCPECGYPFTWTELLKPENRSHSFSFEHQSHRRWRAMWKTAAAGLLPTKFWGKASPAEPSFPKRLMLYWALTTLIGLAGQGAIVGYTAVVEYNRWRWRWQPEATKAALMAIPCMIVTLLWPWAMMGALLVFQISMFRHKIRESHVVRCVVYSADYMLWVGLVLGAEVLGCLIATLLNRSPGALLAGTLVLLMLAGLLIFTYRLCRAYSLYLRFDHPVATVLFAEVMAGLALLAVFMYGGDLLFMISRYLW